MELAAVLALFVAMLWLSGRNWELRSPYPPVRMHGNAERVTVDRVSGPTRDEVVRTVSRYR
jgi:hypothetical protein